MSAPAESVAVIVPCFNAGDTLAETVASARGEAGELVVVDDGSDDAATLRLLDELASDGVTIVHRPNGGLGPARMTGLDATEAPYVFPLDADDLLEPGALRLLSEALDGDPGSSFAWGDMQTFGLTSFRMPSAPTLDPWLVTYANLMTYSALFRREAILAVGGWPFSRALEDWALWLALAERGERGVYVPEVVLRYRRRQGSMLMTSLDEFEKLYAWLQEIHPRLFAERPLHRSRSSAPAILKVLVPVVDSIPRLSRLRKVWACQALSLAFWNGGLRFALSLVVRTLAARARPGWTGTGPSSR